MIYPDRSAVSAELCVDRLDGMTAQFNPRRDHQPTILAD
jgi:hypothetical protein